MRWGEEYIAQCVDELEEIAVNKDDKGKDIKRHRIKVNIPKAAGLAIYISEASNGELNPSRQYLYQLADRYKKFSDILEKINAIQEEKVINGALGGHYNSNIAKLLLGKHGYSDKQEITGKDGEPLFNSEKKRKSDSLINKFLS